MGIVYLALGIFYSLVLLYFWIGIWRTPRQTGTNRMTVTVLVPARNEEKHIRECLESLAAQSYPADLFRVIVIDDQSTDRTAEIVEQFVKGRKNFRLLRYRNSGTHPTYKKQALNFAMQFVQSELVFTIDADTVAQPEWLERMVNHYDHQTGMVAGLVTFRAEAEERLFDRLQTLEFAGIVFCGVGAVGNHNPIICNGSNLSYRMVAFQEVGGYEGHLHIPSGDDDLLMQNIHRHTHWKVRYSLDERTINFTQPVATVADFLNQRSRWASKALHYPSRWIFPFLLGIYLFFLLTVLAPLLGVTGILEWRTVGLGLGLKIVPEFLIIIQALRVLRRNDLLRYFPVAELFHAPYILYVGFRGFFNKYSWKDRHK